MVDRGCNYHRQLRVTAPSSDDDLPTDFVPGDMDVICSRGSESFHHAGNIRLRDLVTRHKAEYAGADTKFRKTLLVTEMVETILQGNNNNNTACFCQWDKHRQRWKRVNDRLAREKVGQLFRRLLMDRNHNNNNTEDPSAPSETAAPNENSNNHQEPNGNQGQTSDGSTTADESDEQQRPPPLQRTVTNDAMSSSRSTNKNPTTRAKTRTTTPPTVVLPMANIPTKFNNLPSMYRNNNNNNNTDNDDDDDDDLSTKSIQGQKRALHHTIDDDASLPKRHKPTTEHPRNDEMSPRNEPQQAHALPQQQYLPQQQPPPKLQHLLQKQEQFLVQQQQQQLATTTPTEPPPPQCTNVPVQSSSPMIVLQIASDAARSPAVLVMPHNNNTDDDGALNQPAGAAAASLQPVPLTTNTAATTNHGPQYYLLLPGNLTLTPLRVVPVLHAGPTMEPVMPPETVSSHTAAEPVHHSHNDNDETCNVSLAAEGHE